MWFAPISCARRVVWTRRRTRNHSGGPEKVTGQQSRCALPWDAAEVRVVLERARADRSPEASRRKPRSRARTDGAISIQQPLNRTLSRSRRSRRTRRSRCVNDPHSQQFTESRGNHACTSREALTPKCRFGDVALFAKAAASGGRARGRAFYARRQRAGR